MNDSEISAWIKTHLSISTNVNICCGELEVTTSLCLDGEEFDRSKNVVRLPDDRDDRY